MSDPLYDLLQPHLPKTSSQEATSQPDHTSQVKYLSRLLSLRLLDLTTTEPQSLTQAHHSNHVSLQALSSRSHRTTTESASHLSTLHSSLPSLSHSVTQVREAIPSLDESAVSFASAYAKTRDRDVESNANIVTNNNNPTLQARKESMLLARQSDKLTDILDLPSLLSTAIASAGSGAAGSANYTQALDLHAHIKRLSITYPDSALVKSVQTEAEAAMKSMTTNLLNSLRSQNIRLAAAIRTVGWLRRVVPELASHRAVLMSTPKTEGSASSSTAVLPGFTAPAVAESTLSEGSFGALFLVSRLHTFLSMTEALAPLRDLADQETSRRTATLSASISNTTGTSAASSSSTTLSVAPTTTRRGSSIHPSTTNSSSASHGTQTERYLKRYIEIFREQSFSTISMYRNIFPVMEHDPAEQQKANSSETNVDPLALPSALQQFPFHLVEILMEVLRTYLPNVTDPAARESLLMQVLYAANSLGRLGADFSMMISLLDEETKAIVHMEESKAEDVKVTEEATNTEAEKTQPEPEWVRIIKKHKVQAARLEALAASQNQDSRRGSDIPVR